MGVCSAYVCVVCVCVRSCVRASVGVCIACVCYVCVRCAARVGVRGCIMWVFEMSLRRLTLALYVMALDVVKYQLRLRLLLHLSCWNESCT